ncbi:LAFA_0G02916g1_1 [Lachancea sp. 'fantastica']|nr:LAFA_0G02916g1_1 [Lachancea sp. 'fantastica']
MHKYSHITTEIRFTPKPNMQIGLGIDLGSTDVRVGAYNLFTNELVAVKSSSVPYYNHGNKRVTQSTDEIISAIVECIGMLNVDLSMIKSCGVAATCSLAFFEYNNVKGLIPHRLYELETEPVQNVVFWMDSTATKQAEELNALNGSEKQFLGGGFIPEMGIPKLNAFLETLSNSSTKSFEVFDLHTFIAYDLAQKYRWDATLLLNKPNQNGIGHDGEVRGWSDQFYRNPVKLLNIVRIGPVRINRMWSPVKVASCIDCYAGWFAMCLPKPDRTLFMAAGTSTCYLFAKPSSNQCIPGIWGPFTDIIDEGSDRTWSVYEAGQSTTGKLLEHLFKSHPAAQQYLLGGISLFDVLERAIEDVERSTGQSVHLLTKYMFTYGELQGNRTPFCDPNMTGMFIGETTDTSLQDLMFKYVTVLEFLAFQAKQIRDCLGADIENITVSGSQAKNSRLLSLISMVNGGLPVRKPMKRAELMGVRGAFLLGKSRYLNESLLSTGTEHSADFALLEVETLPSLKDNDNVRRLLAVKYEIYLDMAKVQRKYRTMVDVQVS